MICLHAQDSREMAQALLSVSRRCDAIGARLCFVGSESRLERARRIVSEHDPQGLHGVCFRPLGSSGGPVAETSWRETMAEVLVALRPSGGETPPTVSWVDAPVPASGAGPLLASFVRAVQAIPAPRAVVGAWELDRLTADGRASLFEVSRTVMSARVLLPECPRWFLHGYGHGPTAEMGTLGVTTPEKQATLGQLGAIIAHELGNPLSIISSSLQYLRERLISSHDASSEFASAALANVERIQVLLRRMLDAGAPGKAVFERASLNDLAPELLRLTASECERRAVGVEVSFDPRIPVAWIDSQGVKQIVLNLLKNGLDALDGHGGKLRVRTRLSDAGDEMFLEIENDGPGIEADVLPHLFRPFHSTKPGGTGLGLYLSRQIARDHGGDLDVDNLTDGGVRFTLKLPVDRRRGGELGAHPDRR